MGDGYGGPAYRKRRETVDDLNAEFDALMQEMAENDDDAFTGKSTKIWKMMKIYYTVVLFYQCKFFLIEQKFYFSKLWRALFIRTKVEL